MINSKQRGYLRALANTMDAILQVGKGGINDNLIKHVNEALEARELIKMTVLNNSAESPSDICGQIAAATNAETIQVIGKKIVLYRESVENKTIELPRD